MKNKILSLLKSPIDGDNLLGYTLLVRMYGKSSTPDFIREEKIIISTKHKILRIRYNKDYWNVVDKKIPL